MTEILSDPTSTITPPVPIDETQPVTYRWPDLPNLCEICKARDGVYVVEDTFRDQPVTFAVCSACAPLDPNWAGTVRLRTQWATILGPMLGGILFSAVTFWALSGVPTI